MQGIEISYRCVGCELPVVRFTFSDDFAGLAKALRTFLGTARRCTRCDKLDEVPAELRKEITDALDGYDAAMALVLGNLDGTDAAAIVATRAQDRLVERVRDITKGP